jgi:hypothetical protein
VFTVQECFEPASVSFITQRRKFGRQNLDLDRFKGHYGVLPVVCELIQDLQTELKGSYIFRKKMVLRTCLMHHLKDTDRAGESHFFDIPFLKVVFGYGYFIRGSEL